MKELEEILSKILTKLDSLESGQAALGEKIASLESRQASVESGQASLIAEQSEMRKEMAFYYGSMMKKLDETKSELSSEIKHVANIQEQHQSVLEIMNENQ